jgi:GH15 family glucan-1,4-alpha-glucosidase
MGDLIAHSLEVIRGAQAASGAYPACPAYPTYRYSWFRDGAFIAHAMDLWGRHSSAERFYDWAARTIAAHASVVERAEAAAANGKPPAPEDLLHTRYTLDGNPGADEWPNFQLDGFGTLLWGFGRHAAATGTPLPEHWLDAACLLVRYLAALWTLPNADCWEEFPDRIAVSTLAAIHAGLRSAAVLLAGNPRATLSPPITDTATAIENDPPITLSSRTTDTPVLLERDRLAAVASQTADTVRALVLARGTLDDHLIKQIGGADVVDASLLWACVPFGEHALFAPRNPVMSGTAARIERDLLGASGGVHRYRADTFYGGGEWMLLTALLGEYRLAAGDLEGAEHCRAYVAAHADANGDLPEQTSEAVLAPDRVQEWIDLWGPVAQPLLWSHASYLSLCAALNAAKRGMC